MRTARTVLRGYRPKQIIRLARRRPAKQLQILLIDLSASTLHHQCIAAIKGLIEGGLRQIYRQRNLLLLYGFQEKTMQHIYGPQTAPTDTGKLLSALRVAGATPLRAALQQMHRIIVNLRRPTRSYHVNLYIITDGRCRDIVSDIRFDCEVTVIDAEISPVRVGRCAMIASALNAQYQHILQLPRVRPH